MFQVAAHCWVPFTTKVAPLSHCMLLVQIYSIIHLRVFEIVCPLSAMGMEMAVPFFEKVSPVVNAQLYP